MADEIQGLPQGGQTAPEVPVSSETIPSPAPYSPAPAPTPEPAPLTVRDALANYGLDLRPHFDNDHAVLQHLVGQLREAQSLREQANYGREYQQYAEQFRTWQRQQQAEAQRAATQQQPNWWKAPEYDPKWAQQIMRDPTSGELRPVPGAPHDVVQKYVAFAQHQQEFQTKFAQDPIGAIKPGLEQMMHQVASNLIQQHFGQYQEQTTANGLVNQNAEWLYERLPNGAIATDRTGQRVFTPLGQRYAAHAQNSIQMGIRTTEQQHSYAMAMLERDYLMHQRQAGSQAQQQPQAPAQPQAPLAQGNPANAAYLQRAAQQQQAPAGNVNGSVQQPNGVSQRGLQDALMQAMASAGYAAGQTVPGLR